MTTAKAGSRIGKIGAFLKREFFELLPTVIYFLIGFNLIALTKQIVLADHGVVFVGWKAATIGALLVAKVVLIADKLAIMRWVKGPPAIWPVFYRTALYTIFVFIAQMLEFLIEGWISGGSFGAGVAAIGAHFLPEHIAFVYLWVFVLFANYMAVTELRHSHGAPPLWRFLFSRADARQD